jgi:hypothetical protein
MFVRSRNARRARLSLAEDIQDSPDGLKEVHVQLLQAFAFPHEWD